MMEEDMFSVIHGSPEPVCKSCGKFFCVHTYFNTDRGIFVVCPRGIFVTCPPPEEGA